MKNNLILNIQLVAIFVLVGFLYSFTSKRNEHRKISKPTIEFLNSESPFVTHEMVSNLLKDNFGGTFSIQKDRVNLKNIEQTINKHNLIEKSEVFLSVDGELEAVIKQKTPIARVFNGNTSFYIDYKGGRMPLSSNFTARVPLVYGDFNNRYDKDFVGLLQCIYNDDFLKKNIIGIRVLPDGSVIMKNRDYSYDIIFGRTICMERKFNNYKAFFQKAVQDTLIKSYKKINLKFTKQVVCTK
ncbi:cell division protein FtsQ [Flavobacterium psychrophilum]|uniref:cell division protein FtsQ/DivIB n=1 Tax=Flavobacterium psychrophilum TaxID=96345 RepID=UPI001D098AA7|nr:cell division protein FtsQ [Flavobacterium psychrophilum]MCB5987483.1 cell division protein FtsQ [Flavobacterium psychrophilum]MCB6053256.1 cell division protein FtsQ [Flavobacterium psychrophilum]MCB6055606.1 cell division protein FtsQ [Flavobacterium psychrophilum]MCB6082248.1 cell division protein FtsQ [Flavobacterium psychrophilum]